MMDQRRVGRAEGRIERDAELFERMIMNGFSDEQIAAILDISTAEVEENRIRICRTV